MSATAPRPRQPCPRCGDQLHRVRRVPADGLHRGKRRYRCGSAACGFEGLLPRMEPRRVQRLHAWLVLQRQHLPLAMCGLALVGGLVAAASGLMPAQKPVAPLIVPGAHDDGVPLPSTHPLLLHLQRVSLLPAAHAGTKSDPPATPPLPPIAAPPRGQRPAGPLLAGAAASTAVAAPIQGATAGAVPGQGVAAMAAASQGAVEQPGRGALLNLRRACLWGVPGRQPYRGTVEQALNSAALPPEVVREIARQVRAGTPADRLLIANDGIRATGSGRLFSARNVAMTYGMTLCLNTQVNFRAGHTEGAALYEAADHAGRIYAVMVPEVCGNVSVLGQVTTRQAAGDAAQAAGVVTAMQGDASVRFMPAYLDWDPNSRAVAGSGGTRAVSTPPTLALVVLALGLALAGTASRRR